MYEIHCICISGICQYYYTPKFDTLTNPYKYYSESSNEHADKGTEGDILDTSKTGVEMDIEECANDHFLPSIQTLQGNCQTTVFYLVQLI